MNPGISAQLPKVIAITVCGIAAWALLQAYSAKNQQLSVKPEQFYSGIELDPVESIIGLQTRLPFQTLISAAESATDEIQAGNGEKQSCKRVLGAKVCATLQWQYKIGRDGNVELIRNGNSLQLSLPVGFAGKVSVDGRGGKLLGLRNKDIDGKLELIADLNMNIGTDWCPAIDSQVSYQWISDPRISLIDNIRINLKKSVDKALKRKLSELQTTLNSLIDCEQLREDIGKQWHVHTVKIASKSGTDHWLHVKPVRASASEVFIDSDHIRLSFELGAIVELLQHNTRPPIDMPLPDLQIHRQTPGRVEFSLLVEVPYSQLTDALSRKITGTTFGDKNSINIESIDVYPSGELLTIDVAFSAKTAGNLFNSFGNVYISARPVANPENNTLHLSELKLTRSLDSGLMSALTTVLHSQLLNALQAESTIELEQSLTKVESSIAEALTDPAKTGGVIVSVDAPDVRLIALNPQASGLAAIVHLSTRLDASIPEDVLVR